MRNYASHDRCINYKNAAVAYVTNRPVTVGFAGNMVVLLPNGATFYIFGDDRDFPWTESVHEVSQLAPVCWQ